MQEIAILLSSLAGVATAAAVRKMPRNKTQLLSLGASSQIKSQIRTLNIEKDILTKTISRLYQADSEFSKIKKDRLLLKYQHQLGIILAKLEKLEQASQHPDLGPVGDGLITLMDQKLSSLDDRLYELSSKISSAEITSTEIKQEKPKATEPKDHLLESEIKSTKKTFDFEKPKEELSIKAPKQNRSFELTTLTRLSQKEPKFPSFEKYNKSHQEVKNSVSSKPLVSEIKLKEDIIETKLKTEEKVVRPTTKSEITLEKKPDIIKEVEKITKHKALPEPKKKVDSKTLDEFDDDSDDLDKIKGEIMNVLSKLDQAEVE